VGVAAWSIPALAMAALGLAGITRPSLWSDELATWGMATSSWHDMVAVLRWVDLIIGPYYVLVHAWTDVAGTSDLAIRLPSVVAMTGAAALVGALGVRLANRRVGLVAGLIFALLPSSSRFAQEGRAYALTTFAATLATYLLVGALQRPGFLRYVGYVITVALLGVLHPIALLLLAAHGWVVFAQYRRQTPAWALSASIGALPALPLLWLGNQQKSQVSWIPNPTADSLLQFPHDLVGVTAIGVVLIALALFSMPLRRPTAICTAWAVLPFLGLLAAAQATPIFLARYLLFTLPAWALLAAVALGRGRVVWAVLSLVAVAALAVPGQLAIRAPDGHGEGTRQLADVIAAQGQPGDGVVYGMTDAGGNWVGRDTLAHYLPVDRRPKDVLMTRPERTGGQLAAAECTDVVKCLGDAPRLWVVRLGHLDDPLRGLDGRKEQVLRERYQVTQVWRPTGLTLALVTQKPHR
jgi:mannosyltransferase